MTQSLFAFAAAVLIAWVSPVLADSGSMKIMLAQNSSELAPGAKKGDVCGVETPCAIGLRCYGLKGPITKDTPPPQFGLCCAPGEVIGYTDNNTRRVCAKPLKSAPVPPKPPPKKAARLDPDRACMLQGGRPGREAKVDANGKATGTPKATCDTSGKCADPGTFFCQPNNTNLQTWCCHAGQVCHPELVAGSNFCPGP